MNQSKILPFYMTYPYPMFYEEKDRTLRDIEYIQELYPTEARRILRYVTAYLEWMDYPGSVIYDEYPDKIGIYRIVMEIVKQIQQEADDSASTEKQYLLQELVHLVLYNEILRRRHEKKNGYMLF